MFGVKASAIEAFASELRSWRQQLGLSQVEFADKIAYSPSLVSGVETLAKTPTLDFAQRCDEATGAPGTFARLQKLISREAYPAWFAPVVGFEREALRIHGWELG
jgi:transcriptional regulator with XRE-family HTH domain